MEILKHLNWVDILLVIIVLRISYVAFQSGLAQELVPLLGVLAVTVFGFHYYGPIGNFLTKNIISIPLKLASFISFVALAIIAWFLVKIVSALFEKIFKVEYHSLIDKAGGMVAGIARAFITASLILVIIVMTQVPYLQRSVKSKSLMGMYFLRISPAIYGKVSGFLPTIKLGGTSSSAEGVVKDLVSEEPEGQKAKKEKT